MRFPWNRAEAEMEREIAHHLHQLTAEYKRQGYSDDEALLRAKREFGGREQVKEQCRGERRWAWLTGLHQDVTFGFRIMRKAPVVTLARSARPQPSAIDACEMAGAARHAARDLRWRRGKYGAGGWSGECRGFFLLLQFSNPSTGRFQSC